MGNGRKRRGKHPDKELTAVRVRTAGTGRYFDGNGLVLVVDESGARRWVLRTFIRGKRTEIGLGGVLLVSLSDAREEAARLRKIARSGGDPLAARRKERRVVPTFEAAARQVHGSHSEAFRNAKHKKQWINTLIQYVFPVFGDRPVDQVEVADITRALLPIWLTKPETARRVRQRIKTVLGWAKANGLRLGANPVDEIEDGLPRQRDTVEHYTSLPYDQVPVFIRALRDSDAGTSVKLAFELLILAATRTNEVLGAKWAEFDLEAKTWTVPKDRMKAHSEFRIPLSARCIEILEEAKKLADGGPYVFPGQTAKHPLSNMAFLMTLRRMGRDFTAHGFRSSFRNWASEKTNLPREVCEMALAHTLKDKTEAAYNRTDLFEKRRKLMDAWAAFATAPAAKVVRIRA